MFNRVWELFNDRIVDRVLSETHGTAIIELTTSLKDTIKMLENPKQVIEEEMDRKGSNLNKEMLDVKIVQLLPQLESKTREYPNDSILKMFYELLQQGWKRHLQIIMNYTSFASSVLYWSMSVDEERDPSAFEKYINKLTIRTVFATWLWRKQPHWIRDNRENNETMILFYWYNKSAIDLDYSERYHRSHMSLLDKALYIKTKTKLNDIRLQRQQIIDWYNSIYNKIRLDTQLMLRAEQNWAQQEMKLYKDPNQVIIDLHKVQGEFKTIEELTKTQYQEIEAENVSRNFKLPSQRPDENEQWKVLITEHLQEVRQQVIVYIDELTEQKTNPKFIVLRVAEMLSNDYIPNLKQRLQEQKDQINELSNEHKYDYNINNEPDKFVRIKKYSNDILMSLFFNARYNQLSQLNKSINDVLNTLQTSLPPNHELVSSFYVYIKSHLADPINSYTKDYGILNTFLKEKSDVALEIRDLEYMIEAYNALINWASIIIQQTTTIEDVILALNMTTVNDAMDTFQRQEYQLATIRNEEETHRQDIKFIKKFDLLSYLNLFSDSIEAFNSQAIKILIQEQQSLIKKSNVRSLYTAKLVQELDKIASSSSSNSWQLTHINTVDNDDRSRLINLIQTEIMPNLQSGAPSSTQASYHLLQQFTFADQSLARATLDEVWQCILAIWKIIIITNPIDIISI